MGCACSVQSGVAAGKGRGGKKIVPLPGAACEGHAQLGSATVPAPGSTGVVPLAPFQDPGGASRAVTLLDTASKERAQLVAAAKPALGIREQLASEYELGGMLGRGSFGVVVSARDKHTGNMDAAKIVDAGSGGPTPDSGGDQEKKWDLAMQEIKVWRAVGRHSSVVELRKVFYDSRVVCMVMERCECTVSEKVDSNPDLLFSGLPHLLHQMLLGVEACHQASIVHRDIKPDNYLIGLDGSTVKLCDFNLSALLAPGQTLAGELGTAPFMSPEMLAARHGIGTDVWSYGVMVYFMMYGELPYIPQETTSAAATAAIRAGVPVPRYLETMHRGRSSDSMSFCRDLLQREPGRRCSARGALGHSYFNAALDAKKGLCMVDTRSTLDPFEHDALESDGESLESDDESECP